MSRKKKWEDLTPAERVARREQYLSHGIDPIVRSVNACLRKLKAQAEARAAQRARFHEWRAAA
ncbi:MAG TPA: hypothetical protein VG838_00565 [Opitutaceae bacterium]|nr:hypothetical protein [Opitutaceae bacterium]